MKIYKITATRKMIFPQPKWEMSKVKWETFTQNPQKSSQYCVTRKTKIRAKNSKRRTIIKILKGS